MGYRKTTPTNVILAETKIEIVEERTKFLCKCFISKVLSNGSLMTYNIINNFYKYTSRKNIITPRLIQDSIHSVMRSPPIALKNFNIYNYDYKTITTSIDFDKGLSRAISKAKEPNEVINDYVAAAGTTAIYTDGSKISDNMVGLSCICLPLTLKSVKLSTNLLRYLPRNVWP